MQHDYQSYVCNGIGIVFSAIQTNEVLSWISWIVTLIATVLSISFTLWKWWKKASEDGKITKEEVEELGDIVEQSKDKIEEVNKDGKN